ncbi:MAG: hypothetical protein ACTH2U_07910 [Brevibacterium sp.]
MLADEGRTVWRPSRAGRSPGREPVGGDVRQFRDLRDFLNPESAGSSERFRQLARFYADAAGDLAVVDSRGSDGCADAGSQGLLLLFSTLIRTDHHYSLHTCCDFGKSYWDLRQFFGIALLGPGRLTSSESLLNIVDVFSSETVATERLRRCLHHNQHPLRSISIERHTVAEHSQQSAAGLDPDTIGQARLQQRV